MRIAISFDYDSPAGYRQSFGKQDLPPTADYDGTETLLRVLEAHQVKATFAVVGCVALPGEPPEHCPEQIQRIYAAGHEIASHSMFHKFLPPMTDSELFEDVRSSKAALEACIGRPISGFIPPFNRPTHFPQKMAFSLSERIGAHGRGRARQSVSKMLRTLATAGFGWCRISLQNSFSGLGRKLGLISGQTPVQPFLHDNIVAVPLHATGFAERSISIVRRHLGSDILLALYAHPNQALRDPAVDSESAQNLDRFLATFRNERTSGDISFCAMVDVEAHVRSGAHFQGH